VTVAGCGPLVVNAGQSGYFRTQYGPELFNGIAQNFAKLPAIDQLGVMSDAWSMGLAGYQPVTDFLVLAKATPAEADPQVLSKVAATYLGHRRSTMKACRPNAPRSASWPIAKLRPLLAKSGWSAQGWRGRQCIAILRGELIGTLGGLGDRGRGGRGHSSLQRRQDRPLGHPGALRKTILSVVARTPTPRPGTTSTPRLWPRRPR
jgi:hypothetical protein